MKNSNSTLHDLGALEQTLGYAFKDRRLLERAVTHRSWAHEQVRPGEEEKARLLHNEALEFVGDSVLGLVVADWLFQAFPEVTEGELSRMKHRLVSTQTLARASRRLRIGEHLRIGRGEEKTGGRRKRALLADVFEALLAAIFQDGGFDAAYDFVLRALEEDLAEVSPEMAAAADYKTLLQERLQAARRVTPQYDVIQTEGPPHRRVFRVEVSWDDGHVRGEGRTIKTAEMDAARRALEQMGTPEPAAATD
ncbi:MAG: ribonuclease III [Acidobacteria bacterium]|nr:ribonuclease III [Acidobacteriota bacterium]